MINLFVKKLAVKIKKFPDSKKYEVPLLFRQTNIIINPFSTNAPLTDKPGTWFLLAKCLKNACGRVTF